MSGQYIYDTLDALGVTVKYVDMPPDRDGEYIHRRRLIRLQRGMAHRLHRSTLWHECAHAVFADVPSKFGPVNAKQERRADEWAALRLISLTDYMRAEIIHDGHAEAMAVELDVTIDLLIAFQRTLLVVGDRTYVRPKMGAGQFRHRAEVH
jgi:hypothetical protein